MTDYNQNQDRSFGWDDTIVQDDNFILLPPGDYPFTVTQVERSRYDGGPNIPACNMAIVHIQIKDPVTGGTVNVQSRLLLHSKIEGILSSFFASLGLKKKGEPLQMQWNRVVGAKGMCKIDHREYKDSKYHDVKRWIPSYDNPAGDQTASAGGWAGGRY